MEREVSRISARTIVGPWIRPDTTWSRWASPRTTGFSGAQSAQRLSSGPVPEKFRAGAESDPPTWRALVPSEICPGRADVIFPIIHGTTGEDGALQGFPGDPRHSVRWGGVTASAIDMDKCVFKALLRDAGLPTPRSMLRRGAAPPGRKVRAAFLPVFVKPANGGSSVGVTKVKRPEELYAAIAPALRYDESARSRKRSSAEARVRGPRDDQQRASAGGSSRATSSNYDDKYREDKARLLIPAPIPEAIAAEVRRLALEVFRGCGISGWRQWTSFSSGNRRVPSELNPLPGFTAISMYPKLWEATGFHSLFSSRRAHPARAGPEKERRARLSHKPPAELA